MKQFNGIVVAIQFQDKKMREQPAIMVLGSSQESIKNEIYTKHKTPLDNVNICVKVEGITDELLRLIVISDAGMKIARERMESLKTTEQIDIEQSSRKGILPISKPKPYNSVISTNDIW